MRDNETADVLAENGYKVEQNPDPRPNGREPDYKIEGEWADNLAIESGTPPANICTKISHKMGVSRSLKAVDPKRIQADRVILNLNEWTGELDDLRAAIIRWRLKDTDLSLHDFGLKELLVVKDGKLFRL